MTAGTGPAFALDPAIPPWRNVLDVWDIGQGLPQGSVNALAQTPDGYIWVGTYDGLARFDGFRFEVLRPATTPGLRSASIRALLVDRKGRLWIGTGGGGLSVREEGRIRHLPGSGQWLVRALAEDPDGSLWVGTTTHGLFRVTPEAVVPAVAMPIAEGAHALTALLATRSGDLWVGTHGQGLYLRRKGSVFERHPSVDNDVVLAFLEDREGAIWIGCAASGVLRLRGGEARRFAAADDLGLHNAEALLQDRAGSIWIATSGGGLLRYSQERFERHSRATGFPHDVVASILEDAEGSLWVGTLAAGLVRLQSGSFSSLGRSDGLGDDVVYSVAEDRSGDWWSATAAGILSRAHDGAFRAEAIPGLPARTPLRSVSVAPGGDVWVASYGAGVFRKSGSGWHRYSRADGLRNESVRAILADTSGDVWAATVDGLSRFHEGRWGTLGPEQGLPSRSFICLAEGPGGELWFGTDGAGLGRLRSGQVESFGRAQGLPSGVVLSLRFGRQGLWVGTNAGLCRMRGAGGAIACWTTRNGLPSDNVGQVSEDRDGNVWIGTAGGAARIAAASLDRADGRLDVRRFGRSDGMATTQCTAPSNGPLLTRDGRLLFPTFQGIALVDPSRLPRDEAAPIVHIERLLADGVELPLGAVVSLPKGASRMEIHYAGVCTRSAHLVRFRYRLDGFDPGWIDAEDRRAAYYTAVPPGSYRFVVEASNADGAASQGELDVRLPFLFWQTRSFRFGALIGAALLVLVTFRIRTRSLEERQSTLQRQVAERTAELEAEKARAESASRAKSEFLATMSHEIRTPLNAVIGMTSLLLEDELNEKQRDTLRTIRASGDLLLSVVNDILDFSKIEAGRIQLERIPFDPRECLEECLDLVASAAVSKDLELVLVEDGSLTGQLVQDVARLRQVVSNLLSNAVKFTERGEVVLEARVEAGPDPGAVRLVMTVRDTGAGMSPETLARLFMPFEQGDASTTRRFGGTGLGLAISKRLVTLMGGTVDVASELGRGSSFTVTLPATGTPVERRPPSSRLKGRRAMVVDRSRTAGEALAARLSGWGLLAETGGSAEEAQQAAEPLDLLLIDARVLGEHPERTVAAIRRAQPAAAVVVTRPMGALHEPCGDAVLSKPIHTRSLLRVLRSVMADEEEKTPIEDLQLDLERVAARPARLPILVVEDNAINQKVVLQMLERLGYRPDVALNGLEALEAVGRRAYPTVLMDVRMPEMDGLEATRRIRAFAGIAQPRIIALTAGALEEDAERCLQAGMDDYISKPVRFETLRDKLERKGAAAKEGVSGPPVETPPERQPVLDEESLAKLLAVNPEVMRTLLLEFLHELPGRLEQVAAAAGTAGAGDVTVLAHGLKGTCATFGAVRLAAWLRVLERESQAGRTSAVAQAVSQALREAETLRQAYEREGFLDGRQSAAG